MSYLQTRIYQFKGKVIRQNEKYTVTDNNFLNNMTVSTTILKGGQQTNGHAHEGIDEVYYFFEAPINAAEMIVGDSKFPVGKFDIVFVPGGQFHKVINHDRNLPVEFICFMQKLKREE